MSEIWKNIEGYKGDYQISTFGRIKSFLKKTRNSSGEIVWVKSNKGVIINPSKTGSGYIQATLFKNGQRKYPLVHRLVAKTFIPNPENKPQVNHKNGIKDYNYAINLEWVTHKENAEHASLNNMYPSGENNSMSKLNPEIVKSIRRDYKSGGITYKDLSEKHNVCIATIGNIINNKIWVGI